MKNIDGANGTCVANSAIPFDSVNKPSDTNGLNKLNGFQTDDRTNGSNGVNGKNIASEHAAVANGTGDEHSSSQPPPQPLQTPIAVVGFGCRLPGNSNSPKALWDFLSRGGVADNTPPSDRYNFDAHYDGSQRPGTMPSPGGMLLKDVDLTAFDASFFNTSHSEATIMDPQQRQLLEVTYECLENSGITLDNIRGANVGCIVANNGCGEFDPKLLAR